MSNSLYGNKVTSNIFREDFIESAVGKLTSSEDVLSSIINIEGGDKEAFQSQAESVMNRSSNVFGTETVIGGIENVPLDLLPLLSRDITSFTGKEKKKLARMFYRIDPVVRTCTDINTDAPLSRIKLVPPSIKDDEELSEYIKNFFNSMIDQMKLFSFFNEIFHELSLNREIFGWCTFSEDNKIWSHIKLLEDEYEPEAVKEADGSIRIFIKIPPGMEEVWESEVADLEAGSEEAKLYGKEKRIELPTDPYEGSFAFHIDRKPSSLHEDAVGPMDSAFRLLVSKTLLINAYEAKLRRLSQHTDIYSVPEDPAMVDDLQYKLWVSQHSPSGGPIVCNYEVTQVSKEPAINTFDVAKDLDWINDSLFLNFGLNKTIIQGEASYGADKIPMELINTRFFYMREILTTFWVDFLAKPIALFNGFYLKSVKIEPEYIRSRLMKAYFDKDTIIPVKADIKKDGIEGEEMTSSSVRLLHPEPEEPKDVVEKFLGDYDSYFEKSPYGKFTSSSYKKDLRSTLISSFNFSMSNSKRSVGYGKTNKASFTSSNTKYDGVEGEQVDIYDPYLIWFIPQLSFKRVAITDTDEAFTQLFNLFSQSGLPLRYILDVFNIDSDSAIGELKNDMFTAKDPKISEFFSSFYSTVASTFAENPAFKEMFLDKFNFAGVNAKDVISPEDGEGGDDFSEIG